MSELFDLERTPACARVEDDLAEAVRVVREGGEVASVSSALAAHLAGCARCTQVLAELVRDPGEWAGVMVESADTPAFVEKVLVDGLSQENETVIRRRAAHRLGGLAGVGPATLGALAERATADRDQKVRRISLEALDQLDAAVSIPDRLLEAWAAVPAEAEPFIAGVLERLAVSPIPSVLGLRSGPRTGSGLVVTGQGEIRGSLRDEEQELSLRLEGLPAQFEQTRPVLALPMALSADAGLRWPGDLPGLAPASGPVSRGSLEVAVGRGRPADVSLFDRMYLLNPEVPATLR